MIQRTTVTVDEMNAGDACRGCRFDGLCEQSFGWGCEVAERERRGDGRAALAFEHWYARQEKANDAKSP